ncbi:hypothetical protein KAH43_05965 [Candidatus Bipolaricaulota bacterium]|nr:hypothetical protein [Candidatus Bipolaricaulota bacterium]
MKRLFVLIAVLALLVTGTVSVLADPINVGGNFTTSEATVQHTPNGNAWGYWKNHAGELEILVLLSPINVGGN